MQEADLKKGLHRLMQQRSQYAGAMLISHQTGLENRAKYVRGKMFYICQGSCLCRPVNNRGKVIFCYGDLVPRHGELFPQPGDSSGRLSQRDLLAVQLGTWVFGLIALFVVLVLIKKSISSIRVDMKKVTRKLPWYHDDEDDVSLHSTQRKESMQDGMGEADLDLHGGIAGGPGGANRPGTVGLAKKGVPTSMLAKSRLKGKDYKKGGDALRGKNVLEGARVKEKDLKRTMK